MEKQPAADSPDVAITVKRFLQVEECPLEWRRLNLYLFRDAQVVFYAGQSHLAFVRVWEHFVQGYKARSVVGRFILANWPESMRFTIELMSSSSSRFSPVGNEINAAEFSLIEQYAPCFNEAMNSNPTPVPEHYRPYNGPLRCSRNIKHLIRDAGYIIKAEDKKAWLADGSLL
jgi:hypothetical protein